MGERPSQVPAPTPPPAASRLREQLRAPRPSLGQPSAQPEDGTYHPPIRGSLVFLLLWAHRRSSWGFQPTSHMIASPEDIPDSPGLGSQGPACPERPPTLHGALAPQCTEDKTKVPHGQRTHLQRDPGAPPIPPDAPQPKAASSAGRGGCSATC